MNILSLWHKKLCVKTFFLKIYIRKYLKKLSTWRLDIVQNANTSKLKNTPGEKWANTSNFYSTNVDIIKSTIKFTKIAFIHSFILMIFSIGVLRIIYNFSTFFLLKQCEILVLVPFYYIQIILVKEETFLNLLKQILYLIKKC